MPDANQITVRIKLSAEQREFVSDPAMVKILIAGRRWGKSHTLQSALVKAAEKRGNSVVLLPYQDQATKLFKLMDSTPNIQYLYKSRPKLWPKPEMRWASGHETRFEGFNENPLQQRGGKWTGVLALDESNDLNGAMVKRVLWPKIADTRAQILIVSTITSFNWLYEIYQDGLRGGVVKSFYEKRNPIPNAIGYPTSSGVMFQDADGKQRLADLKSITPRIIWDSEFECIPGSDNSECFPYWKNSFVGTRAPAAPEPGRIYMAGLDIGRVRDNTVLVILDDEFRICEVTVWTPRNPPILPDELAQLVATRVRYWDARCIADSTGAGAKNDPHIEIFQRLMPDMIPFVFSSTRENSTKFDLVTNLMLCTEQRKLKCPFGNGEIISLEAPEGFRLLDMEMRGYKILVSSGAKSIFGAKKEKGGGPEAHDDCVAALLMAAWGIARPEFRRFVQRAGLRPFNR